MTKDQLLDKFAENGRAFAFVTDKKVSCHVIFSHYQRGTNHLILKEDLDTGDVVDSYTLDGEVDETILDRIIEHDNNKKTGIH